MICEKFRSVLAERLELFEFGEEDLDEVSPFVHVRVDFQRLFAPRALRKDDVSTALVHLLDTPVGVKRRVDKDGIKVYAFDQGSNTECVMPVARQEFKAHESAQRVGRGEDFCRPAAS